MKKQKQKQKKKHTLVKAVAIGATIGAGYYLYSRNRKMEVEEELVELESNRKTKIKALVITPLTARKTPLVIFMHGYRAEKTEDNRFVEIARKLAVNGISSIMCDCAGCGDSDDDFENYNLTNNLLDNEACYTYMLEHYNIDKKNVGLVGYSYGGRQAVFFAQMKPEIENMVLIAPALNQGNDALKTIIGDEKEIRRLTKIAEEDGYVEIVDKFKNEKHKLGKKFFSDHQKDPIAAFSNYQHNLLYLQGNQDKIVTPEVSGQVLQLLNPKAKLNYVYLDAADHGFGIWDDRKDISDQLVNISTEFLLRGLK